MRQLGEQWIEEDRHMYKAISKYEKKDLGPVNKEGLLAEERTGLFPTISEVTKGIWKATVYQNEGLMQIEIGIWATTRQQVIYAWNRRP